MGTILTFNSASHLTSHRGKVACQRRTTVAIMVLFTPLPVRWRELELHAERELSKA
ncbi:hypothetical protein BJY52DRAFT_1248679 [Lactarius psammicola]|nr:hypothetical protein BJY52DRAFT_1321908 [Lactarius psammicola]KAI9465099.1 hypothetical protein BJY52DRAFT_1248679 [Lactarius psammicola]